MQTGCDTRRRTAIDLIDREALCALMKDLKLGIRVETRVVEDVAVDERFFAAI